MRSISQMRLIGAGLLVFVAGINHASADAQRGQVIAERWCSACHLVNTGQAQATDGVATFEEIAKRHEVTDDGLRAFLSSPHPTMPDMSLTRDEIRDLVRYIETFE